MKCILCKSKLYDGSELITCDYCKKEFHKECWELNKGCGTPGCKNLPDVDADSSVEEYTYYGQKTKICPYCNEKINISADICPYCNERFDDVKPQTPDELKEKFKQKKVYHDERRVATYILIAGLIGCFAPLNLIFGSIWFFNRKELLKNELPMHFLLTIIGLVLSLVYSIILIIVIINSSLK